MDNVPESIYNYRINKISLKDGTPVEPGRINVFVGANNCGKTQLLKDMLAYMLSLIHISEPTRRV